MVYFFSLIYVLLSIYFIPDYRFLTGLFLFISIPFLLQIVLHLDYYFNDKDVLLEIDYSIKKITHHKKNITTEINFDEIEKIQRFQGSRYQNTYGNYVIPSNFYAYTVILTNNKNKIKFSDFILKDFGLYPIEKKIIIVPFLNLI